MRTTGNTKVKNSRLEQWRRPIVLLIALALVGINLPTTPLAAERLEVRAEDVLPTASVPMLAGTFQAVNNGPGEQFDPHVDCDIASYTSDDNQGSLQVRYFDFATNTDHPIPGNGADSLSDVAGGRIAFTEGTVSGSQIVIFDAVTQARTVVPGFWYRRSSIGGDLVAFEDRSFSSDPQSNTTPAELTVYDLSLEQRFQLTFDSQFDRNPAVSPTGNAVVWEKCQTNSSGCDIYSTIRLGPGLFLTQQLTGPGQDSAPDTNGQLGVYISDKSGENDIYYQPVGGGAEVHIPMPGNQRGVSISGDLIAFESEIQSGTGVQYDIFVYDLRSANLYQVTNTTVRS